MSACQQDITAGSRGQLECGGWVESTCSGSPAGIGTIVFKLNLRVPNAVLVLVALIAVLLVRAVVTVVFDAIAIRVASGADANMRLATKLGLDNFFIHRLDSGGVQVLVGRLQVACKRP